MSRHLRLVEPVAVETSYVVARTAHVRPGLPYVVAACVDRGVAETLALAGHETYGAEEMGNRPDLARALRDWEVGDHRMHRSERVAALAFARSVMERAGRPGPKQHPSRLPRIAGALDQDGLG
jgi:hypothetical protein